MASKMIPVITRFRLNTCEPYIIRYPTPAFDTRNSPMITPMNVRLMFILNVFMMFSLLLGKTSFLNIWLFVALKLWSNLILFLSVFMKA